MMIVMMTTKQCVVLLAAPPYFTKLLQILFEIVNTINPLAALRIYIYASFENSLNTHAP